MASEHQRCNRSCDDCILRMQCTFKPPSTTTIKVSNGKKDSIIKLLNHSIGCANYGRARTITRRRLTA